MNLEAAKICYTFSGTKYFMIIGKIEKNSFFFLEKNQIQVLGVGMLLRKAATCSTPVNIIFLIDQQYEEDYNSFKQH